jgi:putative ATPase
MRANILKDFVGQSHIAAEGFFLRRAISLDRLGSCIFWNRPAAEKRRLQTLSPRRQTANFLEALVTRLEASS